MQCSLLQNTLQTNPVLQNFVNNTGPYFKMQYDCVQKGNALKDPNLTDHLQKAYLPEFKNPQYFRQLSNVSLLGMKVNYCTIDYGPGLGIETELQYNVEIPTDSSG